MRLGNRKIREYLDSRQIKISPLGENAIRVASVDLRLGRTLLHYPQVDSLDPRLLERNPQISTIQIPPHGYLMAPGKWLLGATAEVVELPNHIEGVVSGKSTIARMGLSIEDAGYIDPGWAGRITLELKNNGPMYVTIYEGMPICQIRFSIVEGVDKGYDDFSDSHYFGSHGPVQAIFGEGGQLHRSLDQYGRPRS